MYGAYRCMSCEFALRIGFDGLITLQQRLCAVLAIMWWSLHRKIWRTKTEIGKHLFLPIFHPICFFNFWIVKLVVYAVMQWSRSAYLSITLQFTAARHLIVQWSTVVHLQKTRMFSSSKLWYWSGEARFDWCAEAVLRDCDFFFGGTRSWNH